MATTSTNKMPMLMDRPLHKIADLRGVTISVQSGVDLTAGDSGMVVVDCTQNDGAILECIYFICRTINVNAGQNITEAMTQLGYFVNMYLSPRRDVLAPADAEFIGGFDAKDPAKEGEQVKEGERALYAYAPKVHSPVARVGSVTAAEERTEPTEFQSIYVPKGMALWVAVNKFTAEDTAVDAPLFGCQGGWL